MNGWLAGWLGGYVGGWMDGWMIVSPSPQGRSCSNHLHIPVGYKSYHSRKSGILNTHQTREQTRLD